MKIITIIGARPQFIKAAAVSREFAKHPGIEEIIIHTGQHFDSNMSDIFFDEMQIPRPKYHLQIHSLSHGAMTGQMMEKIESILLEEKPDWVMVYGDTNTTLAGALAAKKLHIRVAHVEAGLRSFNMMMPEEINRILTDRISDLLFCPTDKALENLNKEGFSNFNAKIVKNGDVMQDTALFYTPMAKKPDINTEQAFILATIHRAENTDKQENLSNIFDAFNIISNDIPLVLPLHPRTKALITKYGIKTNPGIHLIEPQGYLQMVYLLQHCIMVMTDSGGLQKEAFFFEKKCLTLRPETEWVELVEKGFNILCGTKPQDILNAYEKTKGLCPDFSVNLYGNGKASEIIAKTLTDTI